MPTCKVCAKSGWFLKVSKDCLCDGCNLQYVSTISRSSEIIEDSIKIIQHSKNPMTRLSRINAAFDNCNRMMGYHQAGMDTITPSPPELIDALEKARQEVVEDFVQAEMLKVRARSSAARTRASKLSPYPQFLAKLAAFYSELSAQTSGPGEFLLGSIGVVEVRARPLRSATGRLSQPVALCLPSRIALLGKAGEGHVSLGRDPPLPLKSHSKRRLADWLAMPDNCSYSTDAEGTPMPSFLLPDMEKKYPHVDDVLTDLPLLPQKEPIVFNAYVKHTRLTRELALISLWKRGAIPRHLEAGDPRTVQTSFARIPRVTLSDSIIGYAHHRGSQEIKLRTIFADQFEALMRTDPVAGLDPYRDPMEARRGPSILFSHRQARLLMSSKILHEMVHWARADVTLVPESREEGEAFEISAYGRMLTALNLGIRYYIQVPGNE